MFDYPIQIQPPISSASSTAAVCSTPNFEELIRLYYQPLMQFAFSMTRCEADASDLTQQTFYIWACKGTQLKNQARAKSWLFTTLHRLFLETRRKALRFPHFNLETVDFEIPEVVPENDRSDAAQLLKALAKLDEVYQKAVLLYYLEDRPYKEIALLLGVPIGTVKSRISRGLGQLQAHLESSAD